MFGMGKINMAVIGTGYMAGIMADTMRGVSHVRSYAVGSRDLDRAMQFGRDHGFKKAYGSYEELVEDRKIDLVYIATPNSEHYENMKLCIEHGKAVLCEKPFTLNAQQAQEIFRLAQENDVFVAEAMWIRYLPFYDQIQTVMASNVIGDPIMLTANLSYNVENIARMTDRDLGGGALMDLGVYALNFASMIFGDDIQRISASSTLTQTGVDESDSITLVYNDGKMAALNCSMSCIGDRRGVVQGTRGFIVIENINNFETMSVYDSSYTKIGSYKRPRQKTGYEYELQECASAIKSGWKETPKMTHAQTLSILHMTDHIRRRTGIVFGGEGQPSEAPAIAEKAEKAETGTTQVRQAETVQAESGKAEAAQNGGEPENTAQSVQPDIPAAEQTTDVHVPVTEAFLHPDSLDENVSSEQRENE